MSPRILVCFALLPVSAALLAAARTSQECDSQSASDVSVAATPFIGKAAAKVYVIPVQGFISPAKAKFVGRAAKEAVAAGADLVVVEIRVDGGRVDAAQSICNHLSALATTPTIAYISNRAWSAGALIALACDRVYMRDTASIGSAVPVTQSATGALSRTERYTSAVRSLFRAQASSKGHNVDLAEAMVDENIELVLATVGGRKGVLRSERVGAVRLSAKIARRDFETVKTVVAKGQLLCLTGSEALEYGLIPATVSSRGEAIAACGVTSPRTAVLESDLLETVHVLATHPRATAWGSLLVVVMGTVILLWLVWLCLRGVWRRLDPGG